MCTHDFYNPLGRRLHYFVPNQAPNRAVQRVGTWQVFLQMHENQCEQNLEKNSNRTKL